MRKGILTACILCTPVWMIVLISAAYWMVP